ncbi:exocyst complex component 3 [Nilaparvata lugens]|uniref:exocyst complex component 3 n=1 Tax=Nilaparvata lugens TaxID=108931 RepID=UPI00193E9319|nr:exocyst complex component 3 [Nilaparvata lugens]
MDVEQLENEARATAVKHVENFFRRPQQLEKLEQYKRRVGRKKVSVEAMLKSAMQSQLDGVCLGLNQLQTALQDIKEIKQNLNEIQDSFSTLTDLGVKLNEVRSKNMNHSQYVTAMENLKHLFTVPESVEKTKQWINEGKLLHAHQSLMDLETSRDELLYELHKLPNQQQADKILLKAYFEDVENISQLMEKQLRLVLSRTLNTVRKEPTVIVTALRIIEREEKADASFLQLQKQSGFLPPGRPKEWRAKAMEVLRASVSQRIEGTQVDERENNKMWLVTYLELTRQLILEDLRVVKTLCGPCFPPRYNIVNEYVKMYHLCLSQHLEEIISNGLHGNEYVSMLSWIVNTYSGPELMQHPDLNIETTSVGPLLKVNVITDLQFKYLSNMKDNYIEWMQKTLEQEKMDWNAQTPPEADQDSYFHTAAPVIIFQMIDQNLQVTKTISQALTHKALLLSMEQVEQYGKLYRDAIIEFKSKHFEDRSQNHFFTQYMITIVNNCIHFVELAQQMKQHYWRADFHNAESGSKFGNLLKAFQDLRNEAARFLLEEAFLDLDVHFQDLITTKWVTSSIPIDTICVTLEDYFQDYKHLRVSNFEHVIQEAENMVVQKYITAMLQKKISFKTYEERRNAGTKVTKEVQQLKDMFKKIAPKMANRVGSPLEAIPCLAEVLKSEDLEILSLDLHNLVDKYPDISEDHLARLLALRGDISRSEIREKSSYILRTNKSRQRASFTISIFRQIP